MEVYLIRNKINQKMYVGITTRKIETRFSEHIREGMAKGEKLLSQAIYKYGAQNFSIEAIDTAKTLKELKEKEMFYIKKYKTYYKDKKGYNMTLGGDTAAKGEENANSKLKKEEVQEIQKLLKNTSMTFVDIASFLNLSIHPSHIRCINEGTQWYNSSLEYPIRKNSKSISKQNENNPANKIKKEEALEIIRLLKETTKDQKEIAKMFDVHHNTVGNINRCIAWSELHEFKENIRKEYGVKMSFKERQLKTEDIIKVIELLSKTKKSQKEISQETGVGLVNISRINTCKKGQIFHNYKENIRKESKGSVS